MKKKPQPVKEKPKPKKEFDVTTAAYDKDFMKRLDRVTEKKHE